MISLRPTVYHIHSSVVFSKTGEQWGGFSNMCRGFPLLVQTYGLVSRENGAYWKPRNYIIPTSESLYQAMRFPFLRSNDGSHFFQEQILTCVNPMMAKMITKPYRALHCRPDWLDVRIDVMLWALRMKLLSNPMKFGDLLISSAPYPIVEYSRKDAFWGAKPLPGSDTILVGQNILGQLLMALRAMLLSRNCQKKLFRVPPPDIPFSSINGEELLPMYYRPGLEQFLYEYGRENFWKS